MALKNIPTIPGKYITTDTANHTIKFPIDLFPARQVKMKVISGSFKFSLDAVCSADSLDYVPGHDDLILTITDIAGFLNIQSAASGAEVHFEI